MTSELPATYGFIRNSDGIQFRLSAETGKVVEGAYQVTPEGKLGERRWITGHQQIFNQWIANDDFVPAVADRFHRFVKDFLNSGAKMRRFLS